MQKSHPWRRIRLTLLSAALWPAAAGAQIESVTRLTANPVRYGRTEFVVMLSAPWENPYRSADITLDLELMAPSGRRLSVPGYYDRGEPGKPSVWRARYAAAEAGVYRGRFVLEVGGARQPPVPVEFAAAPSGARGFLHPAGPWIFRFDNGEPFRGIGENLCWESRSGDDSRYFKELHENPRFNYEYLLGQLSGSGGNFFRTWMCPWNLPLEWHHVIDTSRYADDGRPFNASAARRMDQLVDLAAETDTYFMLTLDTHGALLGGLWELNGYNARNGGPAAKPSDFFTDPGARARYRDRLRYLVARWGWSPHLAVWEFFNEVDNAMYGQKPERIPDSVVVDWHAQMSAYLKSIDPYGRPVTTSISHREVAGLDRVPGLDLNQRHIYRNTLSIPSVIRRQVSLGGKPYAIGEFGYEWDWSKNFNDFAPDMDRDFKLGLWLGLFSPTPVLPMSWWWEFFDSRHLTAYFARVRAVHELMLAAGHGDYREVECPWAGPPLPVYGVRCGRTLFVLVANPASGAVSGALRLQVGPDGARMRMLDTEENRFTGARPLPARSGPVELSVGPDRCLVLIVEDAAP